MTVLALAKIGNQYLLFGAAGLISLVAFVTLILVPALSSYGRIWEKPPPASSRSSCCVPWSWSGS